MKIKGPGISLETTVRPDPSGAFYDVYANVWDDLFADLKSASGRLATELVLPLLSSPRFDCRNIVDVGCGTGYDLEAIHGVSKARGWDTDLWGFDISDEMVAQARKRLGSLTGLQFASDEKADVSGEDFPRWAETFFRGQKMDAALCLGNCLCHNEPEEYRAVFQNISSLLKQGDERPAVVVVEFRDGEKLKEYIETSPYTFKTGDGAFKRCNFEHRSIVSRNANGTIENAFFRYVERDASSFTLHTYWVDIEDNVDYCERERKFKAEVTSARSMNICYVFPDKIQRAMTAAGFQVSSPEDYGCDFQSVLTFGRVFVGTKQ